MLGLPERLVMGGGACFIGLVMIFLGGYLLLRQKTYLDSKTRGVVHIDVPIFGRFRSNYPALAFTFLGTALIVYVLHRYPLEDPPTLPISGRISVHNGRGLAAVPVSIVSASNRTFTDSNGEYLVRIVRQEGEQYWAVSFVSKGNRIEQFDMRSVTIDSATGRGVYNHVFEGDGR